MPSNFRVETPCNSYVSRVFLLQNVRLVGKPRPSAIWFVQIRTVMNFVLFTNNGRKKLNRIWPIHNLFYDGTDFGI